MSKKKTLNAKQSTWHSVKIMSGCLGNAVPENFFKLRINLVINLAETSAQFCSSFEEASTDSNMCCIVL